MRTHAKTPTQADTSARTDQRRRCGFPMTHLCLPSFTSTSKKRRVGDCILALTAHRLPTQPCAAHAFVQQCRRCSLHATTLLGHGIQPLEHGIRSVRYPSACARRAHVCRRFAADNVPVCASHGHVPQHGRDGAVHTAADRAAGAWRALSTPVGAELRCLHARVCVHVCVSPLRARVAPL